MFKFEETKLDDIITKKEYTIINYLDTKVYHNLDTGLNIHYIEKFINRRNLKTTFKILNELEYNPPEESKVLIMGKYINIPRSQIGYGDPGTFYRFSGNIVHAKNWLNDGPIETILRKIRYQLEIYTGVRYNFVLINKYENGNQYIGYHSDDEKDLGEEPMIAGISFGATRPIYFRDKDTQKTDIEINLEPGSVVLMKHPTNLYWKHTIPRTSKQIGARISLTFRKML